LIAAPTRELATGFHRNAIKFTGPITESAGDDAHRSHMPLLYALGDNLALHGPRSG